MSARKLLVLTGVVVALFAFIFFLERKMPTTAERQQKGDLHWDLPEDRVERIRLERGGETVELAKSGDAWKLVLPEAYPADSFAAGELASELADLKNPGGEPASEGKPEDYGLVKPVATATITWTDPKSPAKRLSRTIAFGIDIPGTDVTAARVTGAPGILFVPASVAASVRKPVDELKSKDVFGASPPDVSRIDVSRGRGSLALAKKNGVWWLEQPLNDLADRDVVERLAADLSSLRVTEFVPRAQAADLAALGLAPPVFRVTITDSKGAKHVLDLGSTRSDGNSVYASRQGQVFTVGNALLEELSREAVSFRDKRLVRFDRNDVTGVDARTGPARHSFARSQAGWSVDGRPLIASAADDLLTALTDAESVAFLDDSQAKALALRQPESEIVVRLSAGPTWKIALYPLRAELAAAVSGRPGAFTVSREAMDRLAAASEKAAAAPPAARTPAVTPGPGSR
ncbi:MAG: DUF4340 domain-containing protein [Acidobacteriota bacterium]|nr:DUF4340 domain-containing protein [Acidobacteriota bacterium]